MTRHWRSDRCRLAAAGLLALALAVTAVCAHGGTTARSTFGTETTPRQEQAVASHRGYRATHLFDAAVSDRQGRALGAVDDLIVDMCSGDVRYALLTLGEGLLPGGGRKTTVAVSALRGPVVGALENPESRLVLDMDPRQLVGLSEANGTGEAPAAPATCAPVVSARWLVGRDLFGSDGPNIGRLADLVIDMNRARVQFAVLKFDPEPGPPDRLLAFPLQLFRIEVGGRLVLPVPVAALRKLPGFIESAWSHVLSPAELADLDRQFFADFPAVWDRSPRTLFEHLDRDQSGALSRDETASNAQAHAHFTVIDRDGDQRLSKVEFVRNFPGAASR